MEWRETESRERNTESRERSECIPDAIKTIRRTSNEWIKGEINE